ncbi:hypothetical protein OG782_19880 [Streptomyces sp. NBC_00876]|uniref:hypothetical protein n=1 Tax=Streptomyces sp. NBC_00876 TaxID=2975853 RepID=UPI00386779D2|nr:hypothetical protein OG782_19880 [Streptomyces sp. NBC_00876]
MTNELAGATELLDAGDVPGTVRALRPLADAAPLKDLAELVHRLATTVGFDDLATTARAAARNPDRPQELYDFGYACVERGVPFLAVPALREALRQLPGSRTLRAELVSALERENRHADAAAVLAAPGGELPDWPERYLLVHNSLFAGDLPRARAAFERLSAPDDAKWEWAHGRITDMLRRAETAAQAGPLGHRDLRGWHYTLTGGYLAMLSPYGFDSPMTGRYAYLGDSFELCRHGIDRLALVLRTTGRTPRSVSLLPGRSDRILGLAAAQVLGLPTEPYDPQRTDTVVVAYDITAVEPDTAVTLRRRPDGQILFEHATCWTDPPIATADVSTLLVQTVIRPWDPSMRMDENGAEQVPADDRPEPDIAAEIVRAEGTPDTGDGQTPPDGDAEFAAYVRATSGGWATRPRDQVDSPGPVPSSRFA